MEDDDAKVAFDVLSAVSAAALSGALDDQLAEKIATRIFGHDEVDLTVLAGDLERCAWRIRDSFDEDADS
jgi:hypothetical protein